MIDLLLSGTAATLSTFLWSLADYCTEYIVPLHLFTFVGYSERSWSQVLHSLPSLTFITCQAITTLVKSQSTMCPLRFPHGSVDRGISSLESSQHIASDAL